jgi:mRNA-degrading endonuclease RelE of RelBE toxin-antitoxin system
MGRLSLTAIAYLLIMVRMFTLEFAAGVYDDLKALRARERKLILDKIDEQLLHNPTEQTRNKKILVGLEPPWEHEQPVWELRMGKYRVFYDVNEEEQRDIVRAVREKPPHQTTEDVL